MSSALPTRSSPAGHAIDTIASRIHTLRGQRVMIDADLAALYEVPTKRFNEAVKRNTGRFPADFMFQLTQDEWEALRSHSATSNETEVLRETGSTPTTRGGRRYLPYAFTEHGVAMAAMILNSERAVEVSVYVVRAFVQLRSLLAANEQLARELKALEKRIAQKLSSHDQALAGILDTLRILMQPPPEPHHEPTPLKRPIGFVHPDDKTTPKNSKATQATKAVTAAKAMKAIKTGQAKR